MCTETSEMRANSRRVQTHFVKIAHTQGGAPSPGRCGAFVQSYSDTGTPSHRAAAAAGRAS